MPEFIMKKSDGDREAVRAEAREAMGAAISEAEAEYRPDGRLYDAMEPPAGEVPREPPSTRELRERSYEYGLPEYLQHDLDAYKEGLKNGSSLLDCLWGELYGSINAAEIDDGAITPEHADYLRQKFLWGGGQHGTT